MHNTPFIIKLNNKNWQGQIKLTRYIFNMSHFILYIDQIHLNYYIIIEIRYIFNVEITILLCASELSSVGSDIALYIKGVEVRTSSITLIHLKDGIYSP
jgi:hypothetical protein